MQVTKKYREGLCARVRDARSRSRYKTPELIAARLGITKAAYVKYEFRTLLPYDLIEPFCDATGYDLHFLVTGKYPPLVR